MSKKMFDYEKEAGKYGEYHAGTSKSGRFWGDQGAGCMLLAKSTGRILLMFRSELVNEPRTWSIPGGAIDKGENPSSAARRELKEELRYTGPLNLVASYVFEAEDFRFHNFLGIVPEEFEPSLDWENEGAQWFDLDQLPSPLHFGVRALLSNSKEQIQQIIEKARSKQEALLCAFVRLLID